MARKKFRYTVAVDKTDREIFSIKENSSGDLSIILKGTDNLFKTEGKFTKESSQKENRISIHRSENSKQNGITIVKTLISSGGETERSSSFIKNSKDSIYWNVISVICPDLKNKRYDVSFKDTIKLNKIRENIPHESSLIYHIFVVGKNRNIIKVPICDSHETIFKYFKVVVYSCFLHFPSTHVSVMASMPTSSPTLNGSRILDSAPYEKFYPSGAHSLNNDDISQVINLINQKLYHCLIEILLLINFSEKSLLMNWIPIFTNSPIKSDSDLKIESVPNPEWRPAFQQYPDTKP